MKLNHESYDKTVALVREMRELGLPDSTGKSNNGYVTKKIYKKLKRREELLQHEVLELDRILHTLVDLLNPKHPGFSPTSAYQILREIVSERDNRSNGQ